MIMKIDHLAMYVSDLDATKKIFEKYFGVVSNELYHNTQTGFHSYFLSFEDHTRLEIMNKPDVEDRPKGTFKGFIHMAFNDGSKEAVDELTAQMKADGFEVTSGPRTTGDGYYESCIVGIEDNIIEITI